MKLLLSNNYIVSITNNYKLSYDIRKDIVRIINLITDRVYALIKVKSLYLSSFIEDVNMSNNYEFTDLRGYVEYVTIYN